MAAVEQSSDADARRMLIALEAWLRTKNESAAPALREAVDELLTLHRLKVPPLLRKTLRSTTPIERMFSLVRHSERNLKRPRGRAMLQRWRGTVLLCCEPRFRKVKDHAEIAHGQGHNRGRAGSGGLCAEPAGSLTRTITMERLRTFSTDILIIPGRDAAG
jgi:hypothetical protein